MTESWVDFFFFKVRYQHKTSGIGKKTKQAADILSELSIF